MGDLSGLEGADAVIHLAGLIGTSELFGTVEDAINVNVIGSYRIMRWCLEHGAQYTGITVPDVFPSIYCLTKEASVRLATALHLAEGLRCAHVRTFNAHGPGQAFGPGHPQKFGPTFSVAGWRNEPIPVWGDGTNLVDPIKVADVGRMLVDATGHDDDALFDAGTGTTVTVTEIAEFVLDVTGSKAGIDYRPMRAGETPTNVAATGAGWDRLDWRPEFAWADLEATIDWYKDKTGGVDLSGTRG